ncbi:MAG: transcription antitermination factor NusB [Candidatus Eisenbacteria bacterium]|nr:transcription antitermination factor NusB [Candidatus Eisenbacteria bacterium]
MRTPTAATRRAARETAFRLVYQSDVMAEPVDTAWRAVRDQGALDEDQTALVDDLVRVLHDRAAEVDDRIRAAARNWALDRIAATDRGVLRIAIAELIGRPGTPARVILDEAIDIARRYGTDASGAFVNGVLDPVARELRPGEVA